MLRTLRRAFGFVVGIAEAAVRCAFVLGGLAWTALAAISDFVRARRALRGGVLHCPVGHEVATEGDTYECASCGYRYGGQHASIWECGNVECQAITPFVSCPTCGLSCRNPYRWGRS